MSVAIYLGINIDHVATLRQARRARYPDPVYAALAAEQAGADSITLHLREDRRHIQDHDVLALRGLLQTRMNLELAVTDEMLAIAAAVRPADCCLVPERRLEITTEGGLDVAGQATRVGEAAARLTASGVRVALFIDPDRRQIEAARGTGVPVVELHTGAYAEARGAAAATELGAGLVGQVVQGQTAEDVVHHRAGEPNVRVVGEAGRLEPHVGELGGVGLRRDSVLQAD